MDVEPKLGSDEGMFRFPIRATLWFAAMLLLPIVAAGPFTKKNDEPPLYTMPAENLLLIAADVQRHINDDIYRFQYATDASGQNVFRASLVRLANYESLYPKRMTDVVALSKAQCFEKLCAFGEAGANYLLAGKSEDSNIRKTAEAGYERMTKFAAVEALPLEQTSFATYEKDLEKKITGWEELADKVSTPPYRAAARVQRERLQMQLAQFYVIVRFVQPYSVEDALRRIKKNIDENSESKLLYTHHMMLADLHFDLAKEYTNTNAPDGVKFDARKFEEMCNSARAEYHIVQQADGFAEKLEARGKMSALEAFVQRIIERAR